MNPPPTVPPTTPAATAPRSGFWRRRVRDPLVGLLTQGATPDGLARTLAWSAVCSLFPFLGFTALLNLAIGHALKLNHVVMQACNQLLGPLHLIMILAYVRLGERLWSATGDQRFTVAGMIEAFTNLGIGEFLEKFGRAGLHALTAWALTAPLLGWSVWLIARPALRRLARLKAAERRA